MTIQTLEQFDVMDTNMLATVSGGQCDDLSAFWRGTAEGTVDGIGGGAALGSVVPGLGTLGGAVLGGTAGAIFGMLDGAAAGGCYAS